MIIVDNFMPHYNFNLFIHLVNKTKIILKDENFYLISNKVDDIRSWPVTTK